MDIILGIAGAFVGRFLFTSLGHQGLDGFNLYSMLVAVIGAIVILLIYHLIFRRRAV